MDTSVEMSAEVEAAIEYLWRQIMESAPVNVNFELQRAFGHLLDASEDEGGDK